MDMWKYPEEEELRVVKAPPKMLKELDDEEKYRVATRELKSPVVG
jgi:hypothetical protein